MVRRRILGAACATLLAVGLGGLSAARAVAGPISVQVDRASLTSPLPSGFLGLALEYNTIPRWVGPAASAGQVDPVLLKLIRNLDPTGRPVIRIGGQSTDRSWWPVPGLAQPPGVTYDLTPAWATDALSLAQALDAKLILSVNLEADSLAVSRYEADQLWQRIGSRYVEAMEIGNEADLYRVTPWYRTLDGQRILWFKNTGVPVFSRPPGFDEADFLQEFQRIEAVLPPDVPLVGPDAVSTDWLGPFSHLVSPAGRIRILDSHAYALQNCITDPISPHYPTIPNLLSEYAWHNILGGALPWVAFAHHEGLAYRIDEMGSVTCNGKAGVSDTMASALWVTDALFYAAREGVDGVNLHSYPDSTNGLFDLDASGATTTATIHPIYDGALMFARADPIGSRMLELTSDGPSPVQTWATIGADHKVRILVDNEAGARQVTIHAPIGFGSRPGYLQTLIAPSVAATTGLSLGGQPFSTSTTGVAPAPTLSTVAPGAGGYTITVPADSEALLTLHYRLASHPGG